MRIVLSRYRVIGLAILVSLLLLVAVLAAISAGQQNAEQPPLLYPDYNVHSSAPDGTRALSLWLNDLGYQSRTLEYEPFRLTADARVMFLLFPTLDPTKQQITDIDAWVRQGGTLVVASDRSDSLLTHYGVAATPSLRQPISVRPVQPLLLNPPLQQVTIDTYGSLDFQNPAWVPLLGETTSGRVVAGLLAQGKGRVVVLSTGDPFSNAGLEQPGNAFLVLNLLAGVSPGSAVVIDEYHHGFTEQGTLTYRLVHEPWGWAILYLAFVLFIYVALSGRRFGSVVKPYVQGTRRARAEYATTLAALLQQGEHREWLRERYIEQLKRRLGARFRLRPSASTASFVEQLVDRVPEAVALTQPLAQLDAERVPDERTLISLIRESETLARQLIEHRSSVRQDDSDLVPHTLDQI